MFERDIDLDKSQLEKTNLYKVKWELTRPSLFITYSRHLSPGKFLLDRSEQIYGNHPFLVHVFLYNFYTLSFYGFFCNSSLRFISRTVSCPLSKR